MRNFPKVPRLQVAGRAVTLIALPFFRTIDVATDGEVYADGASFGVYSLLADGHFGVRLTLGGMMTADRFTSREAAIEFLLANGNQSGWYPSDVDMDDSHPSFGAW